MGEDKPKYEILIGDQKLGTVDEGDAIDVEPANLYKGGVIVEGDKTLKIEADVNNISAQQFYDLTREAFNSAANAMGYFSRRVNRFVREVHKVWQKSADAAYLKHCRAKGIRPVGSWRTARLRKKRRRAMYEYIKNAPTAILNILVPPPIERGEVNKVLVVGDDGELYDTGAGVTFKEAGDAGINGSTDAEN